MNDRDIAKKIAMDIGKEVVAYVERMYPQAVEATSSTFRLSLRNTIYNEIMGAIDSKESVVFRLKRRKEDRRELKRLWKKATNTKTP